jgi:hypothetical protein
MDKYILIKRSRTLFGSVAIYQGSDHLLLLEQLLYIQYSSKLFYSDIRGVVVNKTEHFDIGIAVLSLIFLIPGIRYLFSYGGISGTLSIVFLIMLLMHVALGYTCKICIITRVQEKKIGGVLRWRQWKKIKKALVPVIEEQQGRFSAEEYKQYGKSDTQEGLPVSIQL